MRRFLLSALICALLSGCTDPSVGTDIHRETVSEEKVFCVCVGMENSQRFGSCAGCFIDSQHVANFLRGNFGYPVRLLQSEQATKAAVRQAIAEGIRRVSDDGLFIFYYSGHGGQENLNGWSTTEPEGADSADEYLCLYDTYMLDDEIWELISACRARIFLCFDACHSQTLFRSVKSDIARERGLATAQGDEWIQPSGFSFRPRARTLEDISFNMLCWSGCLEKEYSYGSSSGGILTSALLSSWRKGISYEDLWSLADIQVRQTQPGQHPCRTQYGKGFEEAFR